VSDINRITSLFGLGRSGWLAVAFCGSIALFSGFSYYAIIEWRRSAILLALERGLERPSVRR
jgi:hypothetical protein